MTSDNTSNVAVVDPPRAAAITYSWAKRQDANILNHLAYRSAQEQLVQDLWNRRQAICALTKLHLHLSDRDTCEVLPSSEWIVGSFNVCIPVEVKSGSVRKKYMMRCPMPHKHAESRYPGTVEEKIRCEVGTFIWMQEQCPNIPTAFLYGFGFSHQHFTHVTKRPLHIRLLRIFRSHIRSLLRCPILLSQYTANTTDHQLPTAYMLLEYIVPETGKMLSDVWDDRRDDPAHRRTLFAGIAHIILSLARVPQPKIGAFRFHDDCTISLSNRPLTCTVMMLENEGARRTIEQDETYSCTDAFVANMLTLHDNYFVANPSAVANEEDCHNQMAIRMLLWALSHKFINRKRSNGPFCLQITDFNTSNILVNDDTSVKCLLDLEWICALPSEMLAFPYRLTEYAIDEIHEHLPAFDSYRQEFMLQFEEEERKMLHTHGHSLATTMQEAWESKGTWFWYCLESVNALLWIFDDHIRPRFSSFIRSKDEELLSRFWGGSDSFVREKIADYELYDGQLRHLLAD